MDILNKNKTALADTILLIVAIIWGSGFIFTKSSLDSVTPMYLNAIRFWIGFFILFSFSAKKLKGISKKDILSCCLLGFFLYIAFATQTVGLQYTTAGKSAFITGTNVVIVPFIYWIISKEKVDKYSIIAAFICFLGIASLTLDEKVSAIGIGDILTFACAIFFACHIAVTGLFVKKIDAMVLTIIQFLVVAVLSTITAFICEPVPMSINTSTWGSLVFLGVFNTCIAFFLQTYAQQYTYPNHTAIILSLESVFGSILSVIFLSEVFSINMVIGCTAIFIAIITAETKWEFITKKFKASVKENSKCEFKDELNEV